jgi:hypothetical protein
MLSLRTMATIQQLDESAWFSQVGRRDSDYPIVLGSWEEAIESCQSGEWDGLCLEAANQYRMRILERSRERFEAWNTVIVELKRHTVPLVERKTREAVKDERLIKQFIGNVQWDILHLCAEAEYADVFPAGFYASQAYWYVKGHFPCGWQGVFPEGRLIIY